jgi:glutamyl-tRNA synthetase
VAGDGNALAESRTVRTRIAPSPTGDPHVGTAYVALVNYAFAKKNGGQFLLRIEDTDQVRSTPESETAILDSLRWLGLSWDEGPDIGGPHGPYRQSERTAIYREYVDRLVAEGHAFRCFCTPERLDEMREAQRLAKLPPRYDGRCLTVPPAEAAQRALTEPFVIRLKVPSDGVAIVKDLRRGPIEFAWNTVDMQVLMKSDGMPTYHLANVVDDHLMEITHVIRGEEWVSSAPKHLLLYEYFGWQAPQFMHVPLLRNPDKSKLSKRKNPTSIGFYARMGYLPEALLNYLGLLMGSSSEGEEVMTLAQMIDRFDLEHISLGGPVFDIPKLDWLNGRYLREMPVAAFVDRIAGWAGNRERFTRIAALAQARVERLSDLGPLLAFLFAGRLAVSREALLDGTKLAPDDVRRALALAMWELDASPVFDKTVVEAVLKNVGERLERKFRDLARIYYIAMTGSPTSVPLFDAMEMLGRDICRERFRTALEALGGVTSAEQRAWRSAAPEPEPAGVA